MPLEDDTTLLGLATSAKKSSTSGILENFANTLARLSRALQIVLSTNLLGNSHALARIISQGWNKVITRTSSGVTGRWLVFLSSSITRGSRRRSFLQPTRMIGRPAQKCITSEIHYNFVSTGDMKEEWVINLLLNVIEGIRGVYRKADKDDMGIRIAERT